MSYPHICKFVIAGPPGDRRKSRIPGAGTAESGEDPGHPNLKSEVPQV